MHRRVALALALALVGCGSDPPAPSANPATFRQPPAGDVVGADGAHGGHAWLGIRYAEPPVGALRWRAPQPLLPWTGTREALSFGASCPQFASRVPGGDASGPPGTPVGSEDCLTLNVYAPDLSGPIADARLPVMVWIYGGGNSIGTSRSYDGSRLASVHRVIVVTLNYRVGAFGWFRHAALREGRDALDASGNFGTLDQIAALHWVQANVAAFGGDPDNVTIFGESAGGLNVRVLLTSPPARGLFQRAIVQSGGSSSVSVAEAEHLRDAPDPGSTLSSGEIVLALLEREGLATQRASASKVAAAMPPAELASFLRGLPVEKLLSAYGASHSGMYKSPRIFRDGTVIPLEPLSERLDRPEGYHDVPVIFGSNRDEEKTFFFIDPTYVRRWFGILPQARNAVAYERDAAYRSRAWKVSGVDHPASALAGTRPGRVFAYRFDWDEEPSVLWSDLGRLLGAAHGLEIPFVFGNWEIPFGKTGRLLFNDENRAGREALSAAMMSYWAEFALRGDPGRGRDGTLPRWAPWGDDGEKYVVLDTPAGGGVRMTSETESFADLAAAILADETFESERERCTELASLTTWTPERFGEAEYRAAGGGRCSPFPPEQLLAAACSQSPMPGCPY
jgi:para-nitrobenzyl esterase